MGQLSTGQRNNLPSTSFAEPGQRKYPLDTANRARNALARVSQYGTTQEKAKVKAAVSSKYPGITVKNSDKVGKVAITKNASRKRSARKRA